jgi:hypothetical protein
MHAKTVTVLVTALKPVRIGDPLAYGTMGKKCDGLPDWPPLSRRPQPSRELPGLGQPAEALAADWGWHRRHEWPGKAVWCLVVPPTAGYEVPR